MTFLWPETDLPAEPLTDDYNTKPADPLNRITFEQGPARQYMVARSALATFSVSWWMTPHRKLLFDSVLKNDLHNGADWFLINIFTNNSYVQLLCRFVGGSIKHSRSGGMWQVAAQLETYDGNQVPTSAATDAMITALGGVPFSGTGLYIWQSDVLPYQSINDNLQIDSANTLNRADFDQGSIDQPSTYVNGVATYTLTWFFTQKQKFVFDGVLYWHLKQGSAPFLIKLFVNDDYHQLKARLVKGSLSCAMSGDDWLVSAQIETDDIQALTASATAAAL